MLPGHGGTAQASIVLSSNEIAVMVPSCLLVGRCLGRMMVVSSYSAIGLLSR